ncbi:MAG TPA: hypothetical protein VHD83_18055 [Puia sp.]|nr:hypothetical protein [Puia sp.]
MGTLKEDIKTSSNWLVKAFGADRMKLDYSVESFKEIDRFFDLHAENGQPREGGRLSQNRGFVLFAIGSYVGETIIKNVPGAVWKTNDEDPEGEVNIEVVLPDGTSMWPAQRAVKRFMHGGEEGIYAYGMVVVKDIAGTDYWERAKKGQLGFAPKKPWWKFW